MSKESKLRTSDLPGDEESERTSRRTFLARSLAAGGGLMASGAAGCAKEEPTPTVEPEEPALPPGKNPDDFVVHSENPLVLETRRSAFGASAIVPASLLYVRNNLPVPDSAIVEDPDVWSLAVEGVQNPRTVTVGELKTLGLETVATVLQCAGNGRRFFQHEMSGSTWGVGAAGCVLWTGVPVRTVAEALGGVADGMQFVTGTGGEPLPDVADRQERVVERSVPLAKGLEDALLAWEMNGAPLPLAHGGPLRLIVPGYYGCNQIKYLKRLAFTPEESDAAFMRTGYRLRPIGEPGAPGQPTMWSMDVASWINHPGGDEPIAPGPVQISGVAFGGTGGIRRVQVSLDGGETWQRTALVGPDLGPYAWRPFVLPVTLESGTYTLASVAVDRAGNVQAEARVENERGYGNTSWRDHAVRITVS
ncbi:MAG: sulfite oxidase [Rhodothermales bacterium]